MGSVHRMKVDGRRRIALPKRAMDELGIECGDGVLVCCTGQESRCLVILPEKTGASILRKEFTRLALSTQSEW